MKYGIHSKLVEEVIQFTNTMQDFHKIAIPEEIYVINDLHEAKKFAFEEIFGEDEYTWSDTRQKEMGKVKGKLYKLEPSQKPQGLEGITEEIANGLRNQIPKAYSDFFENVVVDLRNCAYNRAINGKSENFYEYIFKIYAFHVVGKVTIQIQE